MVPSSRSFGRNGQDGYVMIVTLVAILLMAIALATAAQLVQGAQRRLGPLTQIEDFRIDALSTRNEAIFSILQANATSDITLDGTSIDTVKGVDPEQFIESEIEVFAQSKAWHDYLLGARLRLDDMPLEIYDRGALINVNSRNDPFIAFIAQVLGVGEPNAAMAALRDFADADDFVAIGGAEQSDYDDDGITVPNRPLTGAQELCEVKHWHSLSVCGDRLAMARLFATSDADFLNFRSANQDLRTLLIGERNMAPLSMQFVRWIEMSEIKGFFDPGIVAGSTGPEYRMIIGPESVTGRFQVVDFVTINGEAARPFEIQNVSEALVPADSSGSPGGSD